LWAAVRNTDILKVVHRNRLRRYGHVLRKDDDDWIKNILLWGLREPDKQADKENILRGCG